MNWNKPKVFAIKHKDLNIRLNSRSGGIFTAISDYVLQSNGVVYGCIINDNFEAVHIRATEIKDRNRMRGSKYIQSNMTDIFNKVKQDCEDGKIVLFSGTSCQISGLKSFLGKDFKNLLCVDIVCHGVPSSKIWKSYLEWQEKRHNAKCESVNFRNKKDYGWKDHVETLIMRKKNNKLIKVDSKIFSTLFYSHCILRPACYKCPYKSIRHPGDISIADYWGIDKVRADFDDNKGVSLVFINNDKGNQYIEFVKESIDFFETEIKDCMRSTYIEPYKCPKEREKFWNDYNNYKFEYITKKYGGNNLKTKIKVILKNIKNKVLRGKNKNGKKKKFRYY